MQVFSLDNRPEGLVDHRKKTTVAIVLIPEPFQLETQEGLMTLSPETVDDWDDGYYVMYPSDGSKPYSCAPKFVRENYVKA